jgi:hypothetical protein
VLVVGRRGDRQNPADRLDPILGPVIVPSRPIALESPAGQ